ncbi:hypothetical protein PVAP13_9NG200300 [Panicum virgatum]|uniref:Uncharacterized protein n=1 Tax=Panicum virgatum TaxID=38727 RepID=A0A8T0MD11_PANVG|nr:hypothetical protein PVAP13_9NG200300 [Panicum virgatum]
MPPRKRLRTCAPRRAAATAPSPTPVLPANLPLEIAARSDAVTIFRCAATCKLLRRGSEPRLPPPRLPWARRRRALQYPRRPRRDLLHAPAHDTQLDLHDVAPGALRVAQRRRAPRAVHTGP